MAKSELKHLSVRVDATTYESLKKLSAKNVKSISEEIRTAIREHLKLPQMEEAQDEMIGMIHEAMSVHYNRLANRLAALFNRNTIIAASAYFTNLAILNEVLSGKGSEEYVYRELASNARKYGLEFANAKNKDALVDFLNDEALQKALKFTKESPIEDEFKDLFKE